MYIVIVDVSGRSFYFIYMNVRLERVGEKGRGHFNYTIIDFFASVCTHM